MTPRRKLKLLLADDHALVREGIRSSLDRYPSLSVIGEAVNGKDAVQKCKKLQPDVILLDINMPEMSGLEATPLIRKQCPKTKIIALTVHDTKEYVFQILRRGAHGYVLKDTSSEELVHAIESVADFGAFFSPAVSQILLQNVVSPDAAAASKAAKLSQREQEVLNLIDEGKTTKEIAAQSNLSARTVETYRVRLKRKLEARNVAELLRRARELRLL
jgi:DNA-binding NarL/FixJ family response regulator